MSTVVVDNVTAASSIVVFVGSMMSNGGIMVRRDWTRDEMSP